MQIGVCTEGGCAVCLVSPKLQQFTPPRMLVTFKVFYLESNLYGTHLTL